MNRLAWAARGLLLLALAAPASGGSADKPFGLLLLGAGGERVWKDVEAAVVKKAGSRYPVEFAAGLADVKNVQKAVDRLQALRVKKIVAVPLFLNSNSELMDETRYLFGIRQDPSLEFFGGDRHGGPSIVRRAQSKVPLVLAQALDDQTVLVEVLASRALALSKTPSSESLVLVSPAPTSETAAEQWGQTLNSLAERVRARGGFKTANGFLLEEGSRQSARDKRRQKLKASVQEMSRHGRVLVVAHTLTPAGLDRQLPRILSGVFMRFNGKALLPDDRLTAWVEQSALAAAKLPDMRVYKDAGRALPKGIPFKGLKR